MWILSSWKTGAWATMETFMNLLTSTNTMKHWIIFKRYFFKKKNCKDSNKVFFSIMENLLSILYATRTGNWKLTFELVNMFLPGTVLYDRHNVARCLTIYCMEMINLEEIHSSIYVKTSWKATFRLNFFWQTIWKIRDR